MRDAVDAALIRKVGIMGRGKLRVYLGATHLVARGPSTGASRRADRVGVGSMYGCTAERLVT